MAEYTGQGQGTLNTVLGALGTASFLGADGGILGGWFGNRGRNGTYEGTTACMHDVDNARAMAEKDAEIARLRSEKYADGVREDAKQYGIEIYKELKKDITELKDANNLKWTDQMVINANVSNGLTALSGQAQATANLVAQITRTAVPSSAICNFNGGCSGCGNNV